VKTRTLTLLASALEVTAGCAFIASPNFVAELLIDKTLSSGGIAIGRVGGFGLLSLGVACWPGADAVSAHVIIALFIYNLLASFYIGYLRIVEGFVSYLLWPACVLHASFAVLFLRPACQAFMQEWRGIHFPKITVEIASEVVLEPNQKAQTISPANQVKSNPKRSGV